MSATPDRNDHEGSTDDHINVNHNTGVRKTSVVWRYFGFWRSDMKQSNVDCKLCRVHVLTKSGNTSNLFHHLKQRHAAEHAQRKRLQTPRGARSPWRLKQTTIQSAFSRATPYDKTPKRHKDLTDAGDCCFGKDMRLINISFFYIVIFIDID